MNRRFLTLASIVASTLLLSGCFGMFSGQTDSSSSASSSVQSSEASPPVVSVFGTVKMTPGPVPTVELITAIGDIYTLLSSQVSFADYDNKAVEIVGLLTRDSTTGNQLIDVQEISLIVADESSSMMSSSEASSFMSSVMQSSSSAMIVFASSSKASAPKPTPTPKPVLSSSSASVVSTPTESPSASFSVEFAARVKKMSRARGAEAWTQQYCSAHVGVCFPARNDFWYKSFGAQSGSLWHVELNSEEFADDAPLGTGPLVVDLVSGRLPDGVPTDQQIVEANGMVVGYRLWTSNRHFEVSAPKELRASVEFIVQSFSPFESANP